jgi:hypothetical protein
MKIEKVGLVMVEGKTFINNFASFVAYPAAQ